jgi:hypothetical protein
MHVEPAPWSQGVGTHLPQPTNLKANRCTA